MGENQISFSLSEMAVNKIIVLQAFCQYLANSSLGRPSLMLCVLLESSPPGNEMCSIPLNILQFPQDLAMLLGLRAPEKRGDSMMAPLLGLISPSLLLYTFLIVIFFGKKDVTIFKLVF